MVSSHYSPPLPQNTYDNVRQIIDIFEKPQMFVWGAVMDHLKKSGKQFYPRYLFEDIENVTRDLHIHGVIHGVRYYVRCIIIPAFPGLVTCPTINITL